ncbi:MAG: lysine--tRNA ligase [Candidatus Thorarchaeota archaeon]
MTEEAPNDEFSIHWIEDVVEEVLQRNEDQYLLNAGKSPSASIHVGILRELIICDVIKRELLKRGEKARTMLIIDDFDPVRSFPSSVSLDLEEWAGIPYSDVPDPFGCCKSFGAHWANELANTFSDFGVDPEVVYNSDIYETEEMRDVIRTCLQKTDTIKEIMIEYVAKDFNDEQRETYLESMKTWSPVSVVCPKCGRLQAGVKGEIVPNRVTIYDQERDTVSFECPACGLSDTLPIAEVRMKLSWRIDWPAKWYIYKVSCEPAGKDHSVKGGSYDTGLEISRKVFGWCGPVKVPYEWVRIGGRDMSTSEGIVFIPKTWLDIAPPELYRFLMLKTDLARAINIQPDRIPDMVDEFDRFERIFFGFEEVADDQKELSKILYPLSTARSLDEGYVPKLPFKFAALTAQLEGTIGKEAMIERSKNVLMKLHNLDHVSDLALQLMEKRLHQARGWVEMFGSERDKVRIPDVVPQEIRSTFAEADRNFIVAFADVLRSGEMDDDDIQAAAFEKARDVGIKEKRAFLILYRILISQKFGPRLGPFINLLGREWVASRLESVL